MFKIKELLSNVLSLEFPLDRYIIKSDLSENKDEQFSFIYKAEIATHKEMIYLVLCNGCGALLAVIVFTSKTIDTN